jgi:gas vesicle protein
VAKRNETIVVRRGGGGLFFGFLLGVITGAVLALLFAPQPGENTREQLTEQSAVLRQRGQERYAVLREQMMERASEAMVQGREAYQKAKDQLLAQYAQNRNGHS